jgi:dipeptidyl aminopeptidase/acylaminoacyl peptidase
MRIDPACVVAEEGATDLAYRYKILHELLESHKGPLKGNLKLDKELWDELAERLGGTPVEAPEVWAKASGHAQAEKINSPILIVTGNGEYAPHCFQMYAALLKAKKICEFTFFQTPRHGFWWSRRDDPILAQADERIFSFLKKYLKE